MAFLRGRHETKKRERERSKKLARFKRRMSLLLPVSLLLGSRSARSLLPGAPRTWLWPGTGMGQRRALWPCGSAGDGTCPCSARSQPALAEPSQHPAELLLGSSSFSAELAPKALQNSPQNPAGRRQVNTHKRKHGGVFLSVEFGSDHWINSLERGSPQTHSTNCCGEELPAACGWQCRISAPARDAVLQPACAKAHGP